MLGGIIASLTIIAALYGMVKFRADDFDKTLMFGLVAFIALLWVVPWGIFALIPLTLLVSFSSPAAREEWTKFKNRRIAIGIIVVLLLNSFGFYPVSEPEAPSEWGNPIATENPHAPAWPASEQYTWFYDGAVIAVVNARTPHTYSPFAQDSSSMALGVMLGVHEERMRQSIDVMDSYIPGFSIDSEAFWLEDVESEGGHEYGGEELFISRFNVKRDGFERILATVLVVGFPNVGGELTLLTITRPITSSQDDVFEEKIVVEFQEINN